MRRVQQRLLKVQLHMFVSYRKHRDWLDSVIMVTVALFVMVKPNLTKYLCHSKQLLAMHMLF